MLIFVGILLAGNPYDSNGLSTGAFSQKKKMASLLAKLIRKLGKQKGYVCGSYL